MRIPLNVSTRSLFKLFISDSSIIRVCICNDAKWWNWNANVAESHMISFMKLASDYLIASSCNFLENLSILYYTFSLGTTPDLVPFTLRRVKYAFLHLRTELSPIFTLPFFFRLRVLWKIHIFNWHPLSHYTQKCDTPEFFMVVCFFRNVRMRLNEGIRGSRMSGNIILKKKRIHKMNAQHAFRGRYESFIYEFYYFECV